ncbi:hypothetical protein V6N13_044615 [Hibiscus sabdariffa]
MMMEGLVCWVLTGFMFLIFCFFNLLQSTNAQDREGCRNLHQGNESARVFEIRSGKRCYSLTTVKDQDYLIRGSFPVVETEGDEFDSSFTVSVGTTPVGEDSLSSEAVVVEGILLALNKYKTIPNNVNTTVPLLPLPTM